MTLTLDVENISLLGTSESTVETARRPSTMVFVWSKDGASKSPATQVQKTEYYSLGSKFCGPYEVVHLALLYWLKPVCSMMTT